MVACFVQHWIVKESRMNRVWGTVKLLIVDGEILPVKRKLWQINSAILVINKTAKGQRRAKKHVMGKYDLIVHGVLATFSNKMAVIWLKLTIFTVWIVNRKAGLFRKISTGHVTLINQSHFLKLWIFQLKGCNRYFQVFPKVWASFMDVPVSVSSCRGFSNI